MDRDPKREIELVDLTAGTFRKLYSGILTDKRLNSVSAQAELILLRLLLTCDDFGNFPAEPDLVKGQALIRRFDIPTEKIAGYLREMHEAKLMQLYEIDGVGYAHITGFVKNHAAKNGKRVRHQPAPPFDDKDGEKIVPPKPKGSKKSQANASNKSNPVQINPDESNPTQMNPDKSRLSQPNPDESRLHNDNEDENEHENGQQEQELKKRRRKRKAPEAPDASVSAGTSAGTSSGSASASAEKSDGPSSDSDSDSAEKAIREEDARYDTARAKAKIHWETKCGPLCGWEQGSKQPPRSAKHNSDLTCLHRWFDDLVWPDGIPLDVGGQRLAVALKVVKDAPTRAKNQNPMQYVGYYLPRKLAGMDE